MSVRCALRRALVGTGSRWRCSHRWRGSGPSLVPDSYSPMEMGYADYGAARPRRTAPGREMQGHPPMAAAVADLTGPRRHAGRRAVTSPQGAFDPPGDGPGRRLHPPRPTSRVPRSPARRSSARSRWQRVVAGGITLHWHGVDVPNAKDGVAGVTQDAVAVGDRHVYRFVAKHAGTYWYHSHQVSHEQVRGGLLGALVVDPAREPDRPTARVEDVALHPTTAADRRRPHGRRRVPAARAAGPRARDQHRQRALRLGLAARRTACRVDGSDVNEPAPVTDRSVVTAGGRVDLEVDGPATVAAAGRHGRRPDRAAGRRAERRARPAWTCSPTAPGRDRSARPGPGRPPFEYEIGRRPRVPRRAARAVVDDQRAPVPGRADVHVGEGDVVRMQITNTAARCTRCTCTATTPWC